MMASSRWGSLPLPEDTSKLAEKSPTEKGWFQQEVSFGLSDTCPHSRQDLQSSNNLSESVVQSAGALGETRRLCDAQVLTLAGWELNPHSEMAYLGFHLPKPPSLKVKTIS